MKKFKTVDAYIKSAPEEIQSKLWKIRDLIMNIAPEAKEIMSYGMPYYSYKGRLAYFGYFKDHVSFFAMNGVNDDFKSEVEKYRTGKATLQFDLNKPLPLTLIKKLLKATKAKNENKK